MICQYCQTDNLHWKQVEGKWRLHYQDGSSHLCRATRDRLVRSLHHEPIGPPTYEQHLLKYLTKEGVKWMLKQKPKTEIPPEDIHDPWWDFLFQDDKKRTGRERAAQQQRFEEMIP